MLTDWEGAMSPEPWDKLLLGFTRCGGGKPIEAVNWGDVSTDRTC